MTIWEHLLPSIPAPPSLYLLQPRYPSTAAAQRFDSGMLEGKRQAGGDRDRKKGREKKRQREREIKREKFHFTQCSPCTDEAFPSL